MAATTEDLKKELWSLISERKINPAITFLKNNGEQLKDVISQASIHEESSLLHYLAWKVSFYDDDDGRKSSIAIRHLVELLLALGADIEHKALSGNTPLHTALEHFNYSMAYLLIKSGANVHTINRRGVTPLNTLVCQMEILETKGIKEIIDLLLHMSCLSERTRLELAIRSSNELMVDLLLESGVDVSFKNNAGGNTPLHLAAQCSSESMIALLLRNGANVLVKNTAEQTPIDLAKGRANNESIVQLLSDACNAKEEIEKKPSRKSLNSSDSSNSNRIYRSSSWSNGLRTQDEQLPSESSNPRSSENSSPRSPK